ncbi:MAG: sigma-70 family RNA polymerase sigma factor [Myxococcales bacterium]|nr:sigma-70 family RNA polymerase sigma factor [Myxococcales bacterium]
MTDRDPHPCEAEELAALVRSGQMDALDRMTRCFGERLRIVASHRCRDMADAEDAVQDALLGAAEHLDAWRGDGKIAAWLTSMVIRACGHQRRGRKNDPSLHTQDAILQSATANPETMAERAELAIPLARALEALAPRDRAIVILSDVEGWRGPEIAEQLQMSAGSVRTRLSRARARLRNELETKVELRGSRAPG